jgi:hypothetical protein
MNQSFFQHKDASVQKLKVEDKTLQWNTAQKKKSQLTENNDTTRKPVYQGTVAVRDERGLQMG